MLNFGPAGGRCYSFKPYFFLIMTLGCNIGCHGNQISQNILPGENSPGEKKKVEHLKSDDSALFSPGKFPPVKNNSAESSLSFSLFSPREKLPGGKKVEHLKSDDSALFSPGKFPPVKIIMLSHHYHSHFSHPGKNYPGENVTKKIKNKKYIHFDYLISN